MRRLLLLCALLVGLTASAQEEVRQLQKLLRAYRTVEQMYLDTVDVEQLTDDAIRGLLEGLDPHSAYLTKEEMKSTEVAIEGEFGGIGVEYQINRDTITVMAVVVGGPAESVGMLAGDRIVKIDTLPAVGFTQQDVLKHLRGEVGSRVRVEVVRRGSETPLEFWLTRAKIPLHTVDAAYMATPRVGYIKLSRFGRTTVEEFAAAYERLGAPRRLILDLRGNGGGLLDQALGLAEFFLPKGSLLLTTKGRTDERKFYARNDGVMRTGEVVVLIDGQSASASEIVAGALQDWDRATIIGRRSFGKGLVQRQLPLGDGSAMRLTISQYHTPTGRAIQRPYTNGERREYYLDNLRGYTDSITDSTPHYRTLKRGRKIYGGGGVRPDVEVQADTTGYTEYYAQLMRRGVLTQTVTDWLDKERNVLLQDHPTLEAFLADYAPSEGIVSALVAAAEKAGVKYNGEQFERSRHWILTLVKAHLAQRLYGIEGFYRVVNPALNESYVEALKHFEK